MDMAPVSSGKTKLSDTRSGFANHTEDVMQEHRIERIGLDTENTLIKRSIASRFLNFIFEFFFLFIRYTAKECKLNYRSRGQSLTLKKDDLGKTKDPTIGQQPKLVIIESDVGEDPNDPIYQQDTLLSLTAHELDRFLEQLRKICNGNNLSFATLSDGLNLFNETLVAGSEVPPYVGWEVTKSYNHIKGLCILFRWR